MNRGSTTPRGAQVCCCFPWIADGCPRRNIPARWHYSADHYSSGSGKIPECESSASQKQLCGCPPAGRGRVTPLAPAHAAPGGVRLWDPIDNEMMQRNGADRALIPSTRTRKRCTSSRTKTPRWPKYSKKPNRARHHGPGRLSEFRYRHSGGRPAVRSFSRHCAQPPFRRHSMNRPLPRAHPRSLFHCSWRGRSADSRSPASNAGTARTLRCRPEGCYRLPFSAEPYDSGEPDLDALLPIRPLSTSSSTKTRYRPVLIPNYVAELAAHFSLRAQ